MKSLFLVWLLLGSAFSSARKILRIQPHVDDSQSYYENDNSQVSIVDARDDQNSKEVSQYSLTNRPSTHQLRAVSRTSNSKSILSKLSKTQQPVQTIRNYNKVNDDGSFTFGYEAADGSFKEETRGTDCVVRGKYGYIDPDGNKREFTYVSGNPCDPNSEIDDNDELLSTKQEREDEEFEGRANYPSIRPLSPIKSNYVKKSKVTTPSTVSNREVSELLNRDINNQEYEISGGPESALLIKPNYHPKVRHNYYSVAPVQTDSLYSTDPYLKATSTPSTESKTIHRSTGVSSKYNGDANPSLIRYLPQYTTPSYTKLDLATTRTLDRESSAATIAITPRPHTIQVATEYLSPTSYIGNHKSSSSNNNERSKVMYSKPHTSTSSSFDGSIQFNITPELEESINTDSVLANVLSSTSPKTLNIKSSKSVYQSQLVYDPSSRQYKTRLYQTLPHPLDNFQIKHKFQPLMNQPLSDVELHQLPSSPEGHASTASRPLQPQEKVYQQQQTEQLLQSQQLFAQQQRHQHHKLQSASAPKYSHLASRKDPQTYYYTVTPSSVPSSTSGISLEQISQFLRGKISTFQ